MSLKHDLGQRIQALRKNKKLTQEQFSELVGIDPKNISKIENGNNYPSPETLVSIAKALDVEIYELFVLNSSIPYDKMRQELSQAILDDNTALYLYQMLKTKR